MSISWLSLCGVLALICTIQATYTYHSAIRCVCNGKSRYCLRDTLGLHCVGCQGNTEGRHCERCKDGFYQQEAGQSCSPCHCNAAGSVSAKCDSRGRCSCKEGVMGEKCDSCPDGPIGPNGCTQSRQIREDSGSRSLPCFCYGHSSRCSAQSGFPVHSITSNFIHGPEGWRAATAQGVTPNDVHFRWSPKHQDLEVISKNSLPVYLYAPAIYLGNQLLSYGQNLSFALRLDRGVRHPSTNDVILEGSGLRISASLGDLRSIVPCGHKITYRFRLDERPGSKWRPQLTSFQLQTLLQNLTAIKIRTTFGENGRGYLDNVRLGSARPGGGGAPAGWVQRCSCPPGYQGEFCERCSSGFRRTDPAQGAFSACEPCNCRGGSCDPQTGDCYSADETPAGGSCAQGFYSDPWQSQACVKCPCPDGVPCSVPFGFLHPKCARCPPGTTGPHCDVCQEGFYGDPAGRGDGVQRPCRPCQCHGHIDLSTAGSCDRSSGECLKCVNNTRGRNCEACLPGFYHIRATDACKSCDCDVLGSQSSQCDDLGRCKCRPGFEGLRCQRSDCPACFSPIKAKMEAYAARLRELETLFSDVDGGLKPINSDEMETFLKATEELVSDLQDNTDRLTEMERSLQGRLSAISQNQLTEGQDIQNIADAADDIKRRQETYRAKAKLVQRLIEEMNRKLKEAKSKLRSAEFPLGDAAQGSDFLSTLVQKASSLADKHQTKADVVEDSATEALSDSEKSLALVRTLMNKENKVKELIGGLKAMYDDTSSRVKSLESQAARLSGEAKGESKIADGMLKEIARLEKEIPSPLKGEMDAVVARLDEMKKAVDGNITGYLDLQDGVQRDKAAVKDLLARGNAAQQQSDKLLARVDAAKAETEAALHRINSNTGELDDALKTLTGFDQQMEDSKTLADAAIKRLPAINATIQQAVRDNAETLSVLGDVTRDHSDTLGTINLLENLVTSLEGMHGSLPPYSGLVKDASKLNEDLKQLRTGAADTAGELAAELGNARRLEREAEEASFGAAAAYKDARHTRDAVGKTLSDINNLLGSIGQTDSVDEQQLSELEKSLADAHKKVNQWLKPQLRDMEDHEDAHRRWLKNINLDIHTIMQDIANLENILKSVPNGCFNSPPNEEP